MEEPKYLDFELRIERKGQRYQADVVHSPCGEASYTFKRPFSDLEVENLILRLGGTRRAARRISTPEMQAARQFGSKLFEAVFGEDVRTCFISSQNEAKHRNLGLRVKLRVEAPELINIPWEYLYDASLGRFLSLFEDTPIVRYIDVRERIAPLAVKPPLSVLVMISSPTDYPTLDVDRERANLQQALGGLIDEGLVTLEWVEKANLSTLADCLLRGQYHVFHYIGHGGFDERSQDGVLVLEDEQCLGQWASGERLAVLLGNEPTLRLVILNACEGARTSCDDPFAGAATTLVRTGKVPAVVAMQFAITDQAAITFARGFYSALTVGRPVDAAVTQARLAIFAAGNDVEWGTPVLYMRSPDGRIFDVEALSLEERAARRATEAARAEAEMRAKHEAEDAAAAQQLAATQAEERKRREEEAREAERQERIAALHAKAQGHLQASRWPEAIASFQAMLELAPAHAEAARQLATAQAELERQQAEERKQCQEEARQAERQRKVATLYAEAQSHVQAGRWSKAITALHAVLDLAPTHAEAARQLIAAQAEVDRQRAAEERRRREEARQAELARLYAAADAAAQARDWSKAIESFEAVLRSDSGYRDAAARLTQARGALDAERLAREQAARLARLSRLATLYGEALAHFQAQRWPEAIAGFEAVVAMDPQYSDPTHGSAAALLVRARQEKERAGLPPPPVVKPPKPTTLPEEIKQAGKPTVLPR